MSQMDHSPCVATHAPRTQTFVIASLVRSGLLGREAAAAWRDLQRVSRLWRDVIDGLVFGRRTLVVTHPQCARHRIPRRAERPERLQFVMDRLLERIPTVAVSQSYEPATIDQLTRFHSEVHVDSIHKLAAKIERSMAALDALELQNGVGSPCTVTNGSMNGDMNGAANGAMNGANGSTAKPRNGVSAPSKHSGSLTTHHHGHAHKPKGKAAYYAQFEFIDIDNDTILMRHTLEAALLAAGGVCHAIDRVLLDQSSEIDEATDERRPRNAFCVVRPPGHHAEPQRSMGFCFFNNIGIGAFHALDKYALDRIAIIDFDVHHGNGTQKRVENEPRLLYVSLHQSPWYPHSGFERERGKHNNIVNIPLPARSSGAVYRDKFKDTVWPRVAAFKPQLVLISAGFDGHASDPLSDMKLQAADFYWITNEIVQMAWQTCHGRVVSVLEGGYNASALADSTEQHVLALLHGSTPHSHRPEHRHHYVGGSIEKR